MLNKYCELGDRCPKCMAEKAFLKESVRAFYNFLCWVWLEALAQQEYHRPENKLTEEQIRRVLFTKLLDDRILKISW